MCYECDGERLQRYDARILFASRNMNALERGTDYNVREERVAEVCRFSFVVSECDAGCA